MFFRLWTRAPRTATQSCDITDENLGKVATSNSTTRAWRRERLLGGRAQRLPRLRAGAGRGASLQRELSGYATPGAARPAGRSAPLRVHGDRVRTAAEPGIHSRLRTRAARRESARSRAPAARPAG